jgi:hypothetical protein
MEASVLRSRLGVELPAFGRNTSASTISTVAVGLCTRPAELDCRMDTVCETCAYFKTGPDFVPVLMRQRDHARRHGQKQRAALFDGLVTAASKDSP